MTTSWVLAVMQLPHQWPSRHPRATNWDMAMATGWEWGESKSSGIHGFTDSAEFMIYQSKSTISEMMMYLDVWKSSVPRHAKQILSFKRTISPPQIASTHECFFENHWWWLAVRKNCLLRLRQRSPFAVYLVQHVIHLPFLYLYIYNIVFIYLFIFIYVSMLSVHEY